MRQRRKWIAVGLGFGGVETGRGFCNRPGVRCARRFLENQEKMGDVNQDKGYGEAGGSPTRSKQGEITEAGVSLLGAGEATTRSSKQQTTDALSRFAGDEVDICEMKMEMDGWTDGGVTACLGGEGDQLGETLLDRVAWLIACWRVLYSR